MALSRQRHACHLAATKRPAAVVKIPIVRKRPAAVTKKLDARKVCKSAKRPAGAHACFPPAAVVAKKPVALGTNASNKSGTKNEASLGIVVTLGLGGKQVHMNASSAWCGSELKAKIQALLPAGHYVQKLVIASQVFPDTKRLADEVASASRCLDVTALLAFPKVHMLEPRSLRDVASILHWDDAFVADAPRAKEIYDDVSSATPEARTIAQRLDSLLQMEKAGGILPCPEEAGMCAPVLRLRSPKGLCDVHLDADKVRGAKTIVISNPCDDLRQACFQALGFGDKIGLWKTSGLWGETGWQFGSHHFWEVDPVSYQPTAAASLEKYLERFDEDNTCLEAEYGQIQNIMGELSSHFLFFVGHLRKAGIKQRMSKFPAILGGVATCGSIVGVLGSWENSHSSQRFAWEVSQGKSP